MGAGRERCVHSFIAAAKKEREKFTPPSAQLGRHGNRSARSPPLAD